MSAKIRKEIWVLCPDKNLLTPKEQCKDCKKNLICNPKSIVRKVRVIYS